MSLICLALLLPALSHPAQEGAVQDFTQSVNAFLESLSAKQREQVKLPFDGEVRKNWHYTPRERAGLSFHDLTAEQEEKALATLQTALSATGYEKVETIRALETVLREMGGGEWRDPDKYDFAVFGEPGHEAPWGFRVEGHHISLHWTIVDGHAMASAPQFLGANPAEVKQGEMEGTRALAPVEDLARELAKSLDTEQREAAILSDSAPPDILTGNSREVSLDDRSGVKWNALSEDQQKTLMQLIEWLAQIQREELAEERLASIRDAGLDNLRFVWMGGVEPNQGHYYRVAGETFLIEYDNTQNNANHIHVVWRAFDGDFGEDLIRKHYESAPDSHGHDAGG